MPPEQAQDQYISHSYNLSCPFFSIHMHFKMDVTSVGVSLALLMIRINFSNNACTVLDADQNCSWDVAMHVLLRTFSSMPCR